MPYFPPPFNEFVTDRVITVSSTSGLADHTTLQAAIDAASSGDTLLLDSEMWDCNSITWKTGITILGLSRVNTVLTWSTTIDSAATYTLEDLTGLAMNFENLNMSFVFDGFVSGGTTNTRGLLLGNDSSSTNLTLTDVDIVVDGQTLTVESGTSNLWGIVLSAATLQLIRSTLTVLANSTSGEGQDVAFGVESTGSSNPDNFRTLFTTMSVSGVGGAGAANVRVYKQGGHSSNLSIFKNSHLNYNLERTSGTVQMEGGTALILTSGNTFTGDDDADNTTNVTKNGYGVVHTDGQDIQYKVNLRNIAGDVATVGDGDIWYNSTAAKFRGRENGTTINFGSVTRISGSSGAAGPDITFQCLTAGSGDITSGTLSASLMTTTGVGVGTWKFVYTILYQSDATGTGIAFGVNHTGTATKFTARWHHITTGGTAATGVGDNVTATEAGQMMEGKHGSTLDAFIGSGSAGVAAVDTDIIAVVEGVIVISVTGSLEFKIASEDAGTAVRISADSMLQLYKIA